MAPLTIVRYGGSARVKRYGKDKWDWSNEDFARQFLQWLVDRYPAYRSGRVCVPDIRDYLFAQFKEETGCRHLEAGSLLRGLGNVTDKAEVIYTDATGRRRTMTEYGVGKG